MLHMCLLLFGIFAICGIVCLSNVYLCLPTKHFFATVFSQIMHISRDSCKIVLWHFSQITLSWCNILFSCIWVASKLFPYAVMSKSILLVDVPLQYRHIFCLVVCNLHLASTASTGIFSPNNDLSHFLQINSFPVETTKWFESTWDITPLSELYLDALNMMHWDFVNQVCGNMYIYNDLCMLDSVWNQVMSCGIPLIVLCHCYSLLLYFHCHLHHWNSLCWNDHVAVLYDMACIWILYFSLLCTSLIMHQQHLSCLSYSSFLEILHNHITLSFFCDNMYKHTCTSLMYHVFSFFSPSTLFVSEWECFWPVKGISFVLIFFSTCICG